EGFRMEVRAAFRDRFHLFNLDAVRFGVSVFANAGQLPRHFHPGFAPRDLEPVPVHFLRDVNRSEAADAGQLIAELAVERFEPIWQRNHGGAVFAEGDDAVVDVHHIGRFDERVIQVFVFGIERMVNLERAHGFRKGPGDIDLSDEFTGITIRACAFALHTNVDSRGFGGDSIHPYAGGTDAFTANADCVA